MAQGAAFHLQEHGFQQQADKAHPLVHLGAACLREDILIPHTLQDGINIVGLTIFLIEFSVLCAVSDLAGDGRCFCSAGDPVPPVL